MKVPLHIKEIYAVLCPECKQKLEDMAKDRIATALAKNILEGPGKRSKKPQ